jgi:serine/threonine protein kinase
MEDLTGRTIDGYQIVEKIGRGGMATVFRAYQPSLDRDVAIKVLPPYYAEQDETFLQRFKREARAIAKLRHPNILMVMDFGEEDDIAYLVMEYVTAGTLKERMKRPIKLDQIYNLVGQVGSALEYAHDLGVVHRDIKPANIMMPSHLSRAAANESIIVLISMLWESCCTRWWWGKSPIQLKLRWLWWSSILSIHCQSHAIRILKSQRICSG